MLETKLSYCFKLRLYCLKTYCIMLGSFYFASLFALNLRMSLNVTYCKYSTVFNVFILFAAR